MFSLKQEKQIAIDRHKILLRKQEAGIGPGRREDCDTETIPNGWHLWLSEVVIQEFIWSGMYITYTLIFEVGNYLAWLSQFWSLILQVTVATRNNLTCCGYAILTSAVGRKLGEDEPAQ